jgi:hypothetical protein
VSTVGGYALDASIRFNDAVAGAVSDDGVAYVSDDLTIQAFRFVLPN